MSGALHEDLSTFYCCRRNKFDIKTYVCSTPYFYVTGRDEYPRNAQRMHLYLSVATMVTLTPRIIPLYVQCLYRVEYFSTCRVFSATKAKIIMWLCYGMSLLEVNLQLTCNLK